MSAAVLSFGVSAEGKHNLILVILFYGKWQRFIQKVIRFVASCFFGKRSLEGFEKLVNLVTMAPIWQHCKCPPDVVIGTAKSFFKATANGHTPTLCHQPMV